MSDLSSLSSFTPQIRRQALVEAAQSIPGGRDLQNVNMHCHSFLSYNAYGWSPCRIAREMRVAGVYAAGLCDFDVLDGMDEFHWAGRVLGLRTAVHMETRTIYPEYGDREIDSPGEPGVSYVMAAGFTAIPDARTPQGRTLASWKETASRRNRDLISRINAHLPEIALDYDQDVIPLTPSGNATERHIIRAYIDKAAIVMPDVDKRSRYWAALLGTGVEEAATLFSTPPQFEEKVRSRLAKRGGLGYAQPTAESFPKIDDFFSWVTACGAIPCESWLDGTSAGESDGRALLECSRAKGAAALNLIPDRNWNIADTATRDRKVRRLHEILTIAEDLCMPVNIGTEMNRHGQPMVDDLSVEALRPFREQILRGARIMTGHTALSLYAGFSYTGPQALSEFGTDVGSKNAVFESVGALPPVDEILAGRLTGQGTSRAFSTIRDSAQHGAWRI